MLTLHGTRVNSEGLGEQRVLPSQPVLPPYVSWLARLAVPSFLWGPQCFYKLWRPGSFRSPALPSSLSLALVTNSKRHWVSWPDALVIVIGTHLGWIYGNELT